MKRGFIFVILSILIGCSFTEHIFAAAETPKELKLIKKYHFDSPITSAAFYPDGKPKGMGGAFTAVAMAGGVKKSDYAPEISSSQETVEKAQTLNVIVKIKTNKDSYQIGEPVQISMEVINKSDKIISAYYSSSQRFDFIVTDAASREIWRWSHRKMFLMVITPFKLESGKSVTYSYVWDKKNNEGKEVPPGRYWITGEIKISPAVESSAKRIDIK